MFNESGTLVRMDGVVSDIEKRKTAELERDRITADLIQRNKDLEQFTYIVSHNLRAPVANIIALSQLLNITAAAAGVENDELLSSLSTSINNMDSIILDLNEILNVRSPGNEKKELVSLRSVITDIEESIKHIIESERVEITCDFSEVDEVFALKSYTHSIFYNLILNSIKYKQANSSPKIEITSGSNGGKTFILFKDNGKGIDVEKHAKELFMLYKRFDTTVEGKGIGLYMVKTAVETLGGSIALKSELNKGCEFRLDFPDALEEATDKNDANKARANTY
jgi:light-regulated signal transduction histidine kinase (bacteriophytochrome)